MAGASTLAWGISIVHGDEASTMKKRAPVRRTVRRTSDSTSVSDDPAGNPDTRSWAGCTAASYTAAHGPHRDFSHPAGRRGNVRNEVRASAFRRVGAAGARRRRGGAGT